MLRSDDSGDTSGASGAKQTRAKRLARRTVDRAEIGSGELTDGSTSSRLTLRILVEREVREVVWATESAHGGTMDGVWEEVDATPRVSGGGAPAPTAGAMGAKPRQRARKG